MIKPIETVYRGYRFRSRLEARWAVFFDSLGLRWEYEPEGFELPSGRYLPDFWLHELNVFVEIKPVAPDEVTLIRPRELALHGNTAVVVYWGEPKVDWPKDVGKIYAWDIKGFTEALPCGAICLAENGFAFDCPTHRTLAANCSFDMVVPIPSPENKVGSDMFDRTKTAINKARSARFEFGESGARV